MPSKNIVAGVGKRIESSRSVVTGEARERSGVKRVSKRQRKRLAKLYDEGKLTKRELRNEVHRITGVR